MSYIKDYRKLIEKCKDIIKEDKPEKGIKKISNIDNKLTRKKIGKKNIQGEYYLTDIIGIAKEQGYELNSCSIPTHKALGVNTLEQLNLVKKFIE